MKLTTSAHLLDSIGMTFLPPPTFDARTCFAISTVVRGPKHHLKRLNAPSSWMLDKLSGTYAPRPSNGPHKLREALPLVVSIDSTRQIQQHPAYPFAMRDAIIDNWT